MMFNPNVNPNPNVNLNVNPNVNSNLNDDKLFALEQYLSGKSPLHAGRTEVPSDEELVAAEAEFDAVVSARKQSARRIALWPWVAGIAAAVVLAFILRPRTLTEETAPLVADALQENQGGVKEEQPLMAQLPHQEPPAVMQKAKRVSPPKKRHDEALQEKVAALSIVPTSADLGASGIMSLGMSSHMKEEDEAPSEEDATPVPADKQILADMYLAEVALQVVYQRQAQSEALRAYAASITGEDMPEAIIAF